MAFFQLDVKFPFLITDDFLNINYGSPGILRLISIFYKIGNCHGGAVVCNGWLGNISFGRYGCTISAYIK